MELLLLLSFLTLVRATSWSYTGLTGPEFWSSINAQCGGSKQSPIDIKMKSVIYDKQLGDFSYTGYDTPPSAMEIANQGLTVKVSVTGSVSISGGRLGNTFNLVQFHLHWGADNTRGSEHTLDGKAYPAALHLVHYNSKYSSISEALSKSDGLAVLGYFLQGGGQTHAGFQKVVSKLPDVAYSGQKTSMTPFAVSDLLPGETGQYIRYQGSLTTPSCDQTVTWSVFPDPISVSDLQLTALRTSLYVDAGKTDHVTVWSHEGVVRLPLQLTALRTSLYVDEAPPTGTTPATWLMSSGTNDTISVTSGSPTPLWDNYRPVQALNERRLTSNIALTGAASDCTISYGAYVVLLVLLWFTLKNYS